MFQSAGGPAPAVLRDDDMLCPLEALLGSPAYGSLAELIAGGPDALGAVRAATQRAPAAIWKPASTLRLLAPIPRPTKNVFCVGRNYYGHVREGYQARGQDVKVPEHPQFFSKPPTTVIGPDDPVRLRRSVSEKMDYEVELAVVIGRSGRDIPKDRALEHVFGLTVVNDITARDLQRRHEQWFKGKALDNTCPMGPCLVPLDDAPEIGSLELTLSVNGEERQRAFASQMIFDVPTLISTLSQGLTLEVGDIIATGTPEGVGYAMSPPRFLVDGDLIECAISGIGRLRNKIELVGDSIGRRGELEHAS